MGRIIGSGCLGTDDRVFLCIGIQSCLVVAEVDRNHAGIRCSVITSGSDSHLFLAGEYAGTEFLRIINDLLHPFTFQRYIAVCIDA